MTTLLYIEIELFCAVTFYHLASHTVHTSHCPKCQWEFQDPKIEVLYYVRPYFVGIFPHVSLTWALYMGGTSNLGSSNGR